MSQAAVSTMQVQRKAEPTTITSMESMYKTNLPTQMTMMKPMIIKLEGAKPLRQMAPYTPQLSMQDRNN